MKPENVYILAIESSCDDTSAAVLCNSRTLSNLVATQRIHEEYGGVVPELASRAHLQNIVPLVHQALTHANIDKKQLSAIAFTRGPGLLGSLLVGTSFSKSLAMGLDIPLIDINHMEAHILAHFIDRDNYTPPPFPFLAMTISGGHTQLVLIHNYNKMEVLGETLDDAVGEAFDKSAKLMGLPYPGGPLVDRYAQDGDPLKFSFPIPKVPELNFSFSGLKTSFLYFLEREKRNNTSFIEVEMANICASLQHTIVSILMQKLRKASKKTGIRHIAIGGGVAANSGIRKALQDAEKELGWKTYVPPLEYCTDNAGMIGIAAYFKYRDGIFADLGISANPRFHIGS